MRFTNSSVNSKAKVFYVIYSQPHWFLQLQTAENIIDDREEAIAVNQIMIEKNNKLIEHKKQRRWRMRTVEKIELEAEIALKDFENQKMAKLLRDAEMELETAQNCKISIIEKHPEIKNATYNDLQHILSGKALLAVLGNHVSSEIIAAQSKLPQGAVNSLLNLSPKDLGTIAEYHQKNLEKFNLNCQEIIETPKLSSDDDQ